MPTDDPIAELHINQARALQALLRGLLLQPGIDADKLRADIQAAADQLGLDPTLPGSVALRNA